MNNKLSRFPNLKRRAQRLNASRALQFASDVRDADARVLATLQTLIRMTPQKASEALMRTPKQDHAPLFMLLNDLSPTFRQYIHQRAARRHQEVLQRQLLFRRQHNQPKIVTRTPNANLRKVSKPWWKSWTRALGF